MTGVAGEKSRRFGYDKESAFETTGVASFANPSGLRSVVVNPGREAVERQELLNTFADIYPPDPGVQLFDAAVEFDACKQNYADLKPLFKGALGSEDTNTPITSVAGTTTASIVKVSAGTPNKIIKVVGNDTKVYLVPVKSFTGGTDANLAMMLPASAIGAGLVATNPGTALGGVFSYVLGGVADTFLTEFDRSGQPGEIKYRGWGCAISQAAFIFELRKRIGWSFGFTGSRWEKAPSSPAMQLANPAVRTNPFLSFACNAHFYQYSAAIAVSNKTILKKLAFSFAPRLITETGTKGLDGNGKITGSDITGYTRAENWADRLTMQITYPDVTIHDKWDPEDSTTYYGLFVEFFAVKPDKAPPTSPRIAIWFPYLQLCAEPTLEIANGGEAMNLAFNIGRDPASTNAAAYIAMTNS